MGLALIVGDRIFIADTSGTVSIFRLSPDPRQAMQLSDGELVPLHTWSFDDAIHATPTVSKGVLFVATQKRLLALELSR